MIELRAVVTQPICQLLLALIKHRSEQGCRAPREQGITPATCSVDQTVCVLSSFSGLAVCLRSVSINVRSTWGGGGGGGGACYACALAEGASG